MAVFLIRCDQLWPPIMYLKTYLDLWLSFICIFIKCSGPKSVFLGHNHSRMAQKELSSFPLRSTVDTYSWPHAWGPLPPSSDHVTSSTVSVAPTCSWAFPAGGLWWEGGPQLLRRVSCSPFTDSTRMATPHPPSSAQDRLSPKPHPRAPPGLRVLPSTALLSWILS